MSDDPDERGARDRNLIDIGSDRECRYWCRKLGVSAALIREAVRAVGPRAQDVERHLRDDADIPRLA